MVKVKLCANRSLDDVRVTADADAQGVILLAEAKGEAELEHAATLIDEVSPFNNAVLVTTVTDPMLLSDLVDVLRPDSVQIHVEMSPLQVERIRRTLGGSARMICLLAVGGDEADCLERARRLADSPLNALLLDARELADAWPLCAEICAELAPLPVILSGGLTPDNVGEAIETVGPYAVDIGDGVETGGHKDPEKVRRLLRQVRCLEC